jgi:hypothetical protein
MHKLVILMSVVIGVVIGFSVGTQLGEMKGRWIIQMECVDRKLGEWKCDPTTGKTTFVYQTTIKVENGT